MSRKYSAKARYAWSFVAKRVAARNIKPLKTLKHIRQLNQAETIAIEENIGTEFFDVYNNPLLQLEIHSGNDSGRHLKDLLIKNENDSNSSNTVKSEVRIGTD